VNAKNKEKDKEKGDVGASGRWLRKLSRKIGGDAQDRGEVVEYLREAALREVIEGDALVMLEGVLGVADIQVRDIMVPRAQMTFLNRDDESEVLLKTVVESGHSRFPVLDEDREKVVGILLAKDLLRLAAQDPDLSDGVQFDIKEFMRPCGVRAGVQAAQRAPARDAPLARSHGDRC
jgi:magnesium and cobalt transporter